ncbi:MAG: hypothetical protein ISR27_05830 [Pseudomonadales bacterium]|nr:hypothetical protein [Pseudomonadales bacterium]MDB3909134.1 hypothetical protein [Gammaproteobacteria bacterium]
MRIGLVDIPGGRKTQLTPTPLVGGVGIFLGILVVSLAMPGLSNEFGSLLSLSALILFIVTVDDAKELTPSSRMLGHSLVAVSMAVVAGVELRSMGALLKQNTVELGILKIPITVFATVGVINAVNMSDGIDGLSGGLTIVTLSFIALLSYSNGQVLTGSFCLIMICSITAFLSLNFRRPWQMKAPVYLGDAGSTMLGFMLAWLLITSRQGMTPTFAPVYALWFLTIPLIDTVNLLIKRPLRGISPFAPGNDHLHHILLARGFTVVQVVLLMVTLSLVCRGIGLSGISADASESLMFQIFIALFSLYFLFGDRIAKEPQH